MKIFFAAIGSYFIILTVSTIFISKVISKIKHKSDLQEQIIFHQINVYNKLLWIPLSYIMLVTPGFIVWLIVSSKIYSYNIQNGEIISANCIRKHISLNKNSYFENPTRIVELQYEFAGKKYKIRTQVPEIVFNQIKEGPFEILTTEKFPRFWIVENCRALNYIKTSSN